MYTVIWRSSATDPELSVSAGSAERVAFPLEGLLRQGHVVS